LLGGRAGSIYADGISSTNECRLWVEPGDSGKFDDHNGAEVFSDEEGADSELAPPEGQDDRRNYDS
jgi:hypothetical protein